MKRAAVTCLVALAAGCTNFQNPTTVVDLRVLAINAEPSEVILNVDVSDPTMPLVDPASNPPIVITPLIVDPEGRPISYTILGCPNNPFGAGPPGPGGGGMGGPFPSGGARTSVGSTICNEDSPNTWALEATPTSSSLGEGVTVQPTADQLRAAFLADLFPDQFGNLHGGFDLGLPFVFQLNIDAGGERMIAVKRVMYWARRINDAQAPNQTPVMEALISYPMREPDTFEPAGEITPLEPNVPLAVPAGGKVWIQPVPAPDIAEPFQTTVLDPNTNLAVPFAVPRETLRYAFYATAGTFAPARSSSELPPGFIGVPHLESEYSAPLEALADPVRIWVVVRDDRGGESWLERSLQIVP